jgi:DNA-binding NarL/FixJ family response regulator
LRTILEQLYKDVLVIKTQIQALVHPNSAAIVNNLDQVAQNLNNLIKDADTKKVQPGEVAELIKKLTPREHQVAMYLKEGMCNKEIAVATGLTIRTVKSHLNTIFEKLNARDRLQAALILQQI